MAARSTTWSRCLTKNSSSENSLAVSSMGLPPRGGRGAPRESADARQQLAKGERLREIVVGAGVQAADAIVDGVARGEHEHRRADAALAQIRAEGEAVTAGQHRVEHDHVEGAERRARSSGGERRLAG